MTRRRKLHGLALIIVVSTALLGGASYLRPIAAEFGGSTGWWWQFAAENGRLRMILLRPIGAMTEGHARIRGEYQRFWRTQYRPNIANMNRFTTVYEDGVTPIFREYAVDTTAFLPTYALFATYLAIWCFVRTARVLQESFWELWRPRNALDATRPTRRRLRKSICAVVFLLTIAAGWDAVQGARTTKYRFVNLQLPWFFYNPVSANIKEAGYEYRPDGMLDSSPFRRVRLTLRHIEDSWVVDFYYRRPCGDRYPIDQKEFAGFVIVRADLESWSGDNFCDRAFATYYESGAACYESPLSVSSFKGTKPVVVSIIFPTWLPAVLMLLFASATYWRGPFRRARRRLSNRCIVCGYHLEGLIEPRCPECAEPMVANSNK